MTPTAAVLSVLVALPVSHTDRNVAADVREAALSTVASSIVKAARNVHERALLIELENAETHGATLVITGHCSAMPLGERCDHGKARSPWQLHRLACPKLWTLEDGSPEALDAAALCAIRQLRGARERFRDHAITPDAGAFCGYAARAPNCASGEKRAASVAGIERMLMRREAQS